MCGIIAYIGRRPALTILLDGLKKLEYRGYDSAGFSVITGNDLVTVKRKGRIQELEKAVDLSATDSRIGIAHTRWATHGEPNEINAHPHLSCDRSIAVVHNGIIENYSVLKEVLISEGHRFTSDTDSEVIAHLIEKFYRGNLESAVAAALENVEGTYGLAVLHRSENKIVVARKGSPMVIGFGQNETIVASDAIAIVAHTKKVVYLNDNEIATVTGTGCAVRKLDGSTITPEVQEIRWTAGQIEKRGFKHFMLKEIYEQPEAILNTLRGRIKDGEIKLSLSVDFGRVKRILLTACGTSWHSALIGKFYFEKYAGIPTEVDYASEFRYRQGVIGEDVLVVVISQSGETADTLAALRKAKSAGAQVVGIVNAVGSTIAREVNSGIYLHAGPEIGVASTKAFVCQTMALLQLSLWFRQEKRLPVPHALIERLSMIPKQIEEILGNAPMIAKIASEYSQKQNALYLGRGISFPVALEGALKLKEISYIHAEGYPAAEMKHGPIALIDENMPVVFLATNGQVFDKVMSNMQEVKARRGIILTVTDRENKILSALSNYIFYVPETDEDLSPLLNVIPLQLLAYDIADQKGLNVDKPRNLAKSVTVE
ncbi:MAG: glutamine--fructose-6-phosphate transaminase (isomerizing) [Candidatus Neomarinimicrobiota bacterium]